MTTSLVGTEQKFSERKVKNTMQVQTEGPRQSLNGKTDIGIDPD